VSAEASPRILLIDGANTLYRAFFALPPLRSPDGTPTNAALGFVNMINKLVREERPDQVVVVFDARGRTFRHERYAEYKAGREAQPEDLSSQIPLVRELIDAYRIPILEVPGFEADDVIATLVARAPENARISVVSTDRDLMQIVSPRVTLLDGIRDRRFGPEEVRERFGVPPERVLDLRALVGDTSDNIPGVKGIGEKGAAKLLEQWGDLDNLLAHVAEVTPPRARTALEAGVDAARISRELATLRLDAPVEDDPEQFALREPDRERLRELFARLGVTRLLESLAQTAPARTGPRPGETGDLFASATGAPSAAATPTPAPVAESDPVEVVGYAERADLAALGAQIAERDAVPLALVCANEGCVDARPLGMALGLGGKRAAYVSFDPQRIRLEDAADALRASFEAPGKLGWLAEDTKRVQGVLGEHGLELALPAFDVALAAGLLDATGARDLPTLVARYLGRRLPSWEDLAGRGAKARPADSLPQLDLARFAAERVAAVAQLTAPLAEALERDGLAQLYHEVELPLTRVLARMERKGVRVDEERLRALSVEYDAQLATTLHEIYTLAGGEFLVSSPKQLQDVLFEKLKLPAVRKTKTGYSTDESVLEQLASQHELPAKILAYRRLAKLKNTYVDALPPLVNPHTGRLHPTFHQLGAATGRLSAANPNVQNIPIRSEEGVRIREAFVPAEGSVLLSADYSQVELRILAHYSGDASLIESFRAGEDIHRRTAAEVGGVAPADVSAEQRARAKAVNFGIIYGLSSFGLANQLGIATGEAQETIDTYFARYRGVRRFIDETIAAAQEDGFVATYMGRRRQLPDLRSRNRTLRQAAERMAVNTVIQGTAADLIKAAMVAVDRALESAGLGARMILQVHDELVFEVPRAELPVVTRLVQEKMENVLPLGVPLAVEVGVGRHWREAHPV
jgi:DNA polymerase-1